MLEVFCTKKLLGLLEKAFYGPIYLKSFYFPAVILQRNTTYSSGFPFFY